MYDSLEFSLHGGCHWYYQSAVAECGCDILFNESIGLSHAQYSRKYATDTSLRTSEFSSYTGQLRACLIFDTSVLIQDLFYSALYRVKGKDTFCHMCKCRVEWSFIRILTYKFYPLVKSAKASEQIPYLLFVQICPFHAYPLQCRTEVEEILMDLIGRFCQNALQLVCLLVQHPHLIRHGRETHGIHSLMPQVAQAAGM